MKNNKIIIGFILVILAFFPSLILEAEQTSNDLFKELYYCEDLDDLSIKAGSCMTVIRMTPLGNNVYLANPDIYQWKEGSSYIGPNYTFYSTLSSSSQTATGFSGVLSTDTAKIINVYEWKNKDNIISAEEIDYEKAFVLPDNLDKSQYSYCGTKGENYQVAIKEEEEGNVFNTLGTNKKIGIHYKESPDVFTIIVEDQGLETECTLIVGHSYTDYCSFYDAGKGECIDKDYFNVQTNIQLFDGTDGNEQLLDEQFQYGQKLSWQHGERIYGWENGDLLSNEKMVIPDNIKSLRISFQQDMPEAKRAFYEEIPGKTIYTSLEKESEVAEDYYYYRSKTKMVCINGGENFTIYANQKSPELILKKGLNVIFLSGTDTETAKQNNRHYRVTDDMSYIIMVYWDGTEGYSSANQSDVDLERIELYQGVYNEKDSLDKFEKVQMKETVNEETGKTEIWIDMDSNNPYLWINAVTKDALAKVEIDNAKNCLGGLFKRLDAGENAFPIHITSSDGEKTSEVIIHVNWTGSRAELSELKSYENVVMLETYNPATRTYYAQKNDDSKPFKFYFTALKDTTVTVLVNRQKYMTVSDTQRQYIKLETDTKEIQWKVVNDSGKSVVYTVYLDRGEENGISESTKQRAKKMIDNMIQGGYITDIKNQTANSYWNIFGTAALGKEYLKGVLAYDVTKHEFRQASDYAAVILELIIAGENPYDYLGINYVKQLLACDDGNGYFGDYSCNIWALTALQAAGAPIPDKTIKIVMSQALNESFDLDMRGWALYALSLVKNQIPKQDYSRCIQSIKEIQIQDETNMNGIDVTGCFENFFYTNRNIMSHACVVSGLTSWGIDVGDEEFDGENGSDPVSILEKYQSGNGGWFYSPNNPVGGGWNKDAVIAVGDLYNGSNVYSRYYLTEDRYKDLVSDAEQLLSGMIIDDTKRTLLQSAYDQAKKYLSEGDSLSIHGTEYYALQEAMYVVDKNVKPGVFLGTAEEREKVENVIKKIDTISSYSYADKEKLDGIKEAYDALKEDRLLHYVTNADVLDKAYNYVESIDTFISSANKLTNINLSKTAKVQKARQLYDSLDDRQKSEEVVKKAYENLVKAEKKIDAAKTADAVTQAITYLGEIITLDSAEDIESVRAAYESLTEEQKTFVTNLDKLEAAEEKIQKLSIQQKNFESAEKVSDLIKQIGTVNQNSEAYIIVARDAYNALEEEEVRYMVDNYYTLLEAEKMYDNLKLRRDLDGVIEMAAYKISKIYDSYNGESVVTENNKDSIAQAITEAKEYIESQTEKWPYIKSLVAEYPELMDIEAELSAYSYSGLETATLEGFISSVGEIGEIDNITLDAQSAIQKAEYLWDHLSTEDQANERVQDEYQTLIKAWEELNSIRSCFNDIQEFIYKVLSIGDVSLEENEYFEAETVYETLSDDVKERVPKEIVEMLGNISESYKSLSEKKEEADIVVKKIEKAFMVVDLSEEAIVKDARNAYDALEYKEYVTNYTDLLASEETILSLKKTVEDQGFADEIIKQIDTLTSVSKSDAEKVEAIRRAYDALTDRQKALVANLSLLEKAESVIAASDNEKSTESIPTNTVAVGETDSSASTATNVSNKTIVMNKKTTRATVYITGKKTKYTLSLVVNGEAISSKKVKWKSSKKTVATVSSKGIVTLKKKGSSIITATYKGKKYTCKLTVKKATFRLKKIKTTIKKGETITIRTTAIPKGTITYKTLNAKIATVTKTGKVTGKKIGKTRIKVVCNGITKYFTVTVK